MEYVGVEEQTLEFGLGVLDLCVRLGASPLLEMLGVVLLISVCKPLEHLHAALVINVEQVGGRHDPPQLDAVLLSG